MASRRTSTSTGGEAVVIERSLRSCGYGRAVAAFSAPVPPGEHLRRDAEVGDGDGCAGADQEHAEYERGHREPDGEEGGNSCQPDRRNLERVAASRGIGWRRRRSE